MSSIELNSHLLTSEIDNTATHMRVELGLALSRNTFRELLACDMEYEKMRADLVYKMIHEIMYEPEFRKLLREWIAVHVTKKEAGQFPS